MLSVPARRKVKVGIVTSCASGLDWIVMLLMNKFLKAVINLLRSQKSLLDPTFFSGGIAHFYKAPFPIQHFDTIPIFYYSSLKKDCGYVIS